MTKTIDFDALSPAQRYVLGMIATTDHNAFHPATIKALLRKGLIVQHEAERLVPGLGTMTMVVYDLSPGVMAQWCEWCAKTYEEPPSP